MSEKLIKRNSPPENWCLVPREMLHWVMPTWGKKKQLVNPLLISEGRIDLISGTKVSKNNKQATSIITYKPAQNQNPNLPKEQLVAQKMLSVFDLRVLSGLLTLMIQVEHKISAVFLFKPCDLINNLGMACAGTTYDRIEKSLADLASFCLETSHPSIKNDYVLSFAETGERRVLDGLDTSPLNDTKETKKRRIYWRVQLGKLMQILSMYPSLFISYPANIYKEVGRSPVAQWLVMFYFGHGHNEAMVYDYKLTTIAEKSGVVEQIGARLINSIKSKANQRDLDSFDLEGLKKTALLYATKIGAINVRKAIGKLADTGVFKLMKIFSGDKKKPFLGKVRSSRHPTHIELKLASLSPTLRKKLASSANIKIGQIAFLAKLIWFSSTNLSKRKFILFKQAAKPNWSFS